MDTDNQTPTQQLAEEITAALVEAGLVEAARNDDLVKNIVSGRIKPDDWSVLVELAIDATGKEPSDGQ
ncbi:MAG: hypothetical protein RIB78_07355 [Gammaproteobacteria bacterium]